MTHLSDVISSMTRRHKSVQRAPTCNGDISGNESASDVAGSDVAIFEIVRDPEEGSGSSLPPPPEMQACLNTLDLVSLGVGSCLGTGMYLTAGLVAATLAGPGGFVSFLIAGVASMLTGICYAELAGLCPKSSGSAYMYAYVTVGEFAAFVIGWGLVVEYVIGTAAGAVALSETLDSMSEGLVSHYSLQVAHLMGLPKFDVLAALICVLLTLLLASGAEMSAKVNNGLNACNVVVLIFFFLAAMILGRPNNMVAGGFFPFGVTGVVGAIPTCYFAYIGFDTLAATGAEAKNPSRTIPRSILLSILFNCLAYTVVILALTYVRPFYLLRPETAMTDAFPGVDFLPGKYIVAVGAVTGEFAATFGSLFPLPRVLTAMACDGLIFKRLGKICPKRHTPVTATMVSGFMAMVFATFIDLQLLIELVLIGTLLAYVMVTFALLFMRYISPEHLHQSHHQPPPSSSLDSAKCIADNGLGKVTETTELSQTRYITEKCHQSGSESPVSEAGFSELNGVVSSSTFRRNSLDDFDDSYDLNDSCSYQRSRGTSCKQPKMSRQPSSSFRQGSVLTKSVSFNGGEPRKIDANGYTDVKGDVHHISSSDNKSVSKSSDSEAKQGRFSRMFRRKQRSEQKSSEYKTLSESSDEDELSSLQSVSSKTSKKRVRCNSAPTTSRNENTESSNLSKSSNIKNLTLDKCKKLDLEKFQENNPERRGEKSEFPSWFRIISEIVDRVSKTSARIQCLLFSIYGVIVVLCAVMSNLWREMADGSIVCLGLLGLLSAIFIMLVGILSFLPQFVDGDAFRAPLVPALPVFVAFLNIFLMTSLQPITWLLFGLWMSVGVVVYLLYGMSHSQAKAATEKTAFVSLPSTPITLVVGTEREERRALLRARDSGSDSD